MGWFTQDKNDDTHTKVSDSGYSVDRQCNTTEFIIADRDGSGHQHVVISDTGDVISDQRIDGR